MYWERQLVFFFGGGAEEEDSSGAKYYILFSLHILAPNYVFRDIFGAKIFEIDLGSYQLEEPITKKTNKTLGLI